MALMGPTGICYSVISGPTSTTINSWTPFSTLWRKPLISSANWVTLDKNGYNNIVITRTKSYEPFVKYIGVGQLSLSSTIIGNNVRYYLGDYNATLNLANLNAGKFLFYGDIFKVKASFDNSIGWHFSSNTTVTQITSESQATSTGVYYQLGSVGSTYTIIRNYQCNGAVNVTFPSLTKDITVDGFFMATPFPLESAFTLTISYTSSWGGSQVATWDVPRQGYGDLGSFICRGYGNTIRLSASSSIGSGTVIEIREDSTTVRVLHANELPFTYTCTLKDINLQIYDG